LDYGIKFLEITDFHIRDKFPALSDHYFSAPFFPRLQLVYELAHFVPPLVRSGSRLVIHVATLSLFCSVRNLIHRVTSNLSSRLQHCTRKHVHMSKRLFLSILRISTETRCISRPLLFQMRRLLKSKRILFYQLLPVVLPEGWWAGPDEVNRPKRPFKCGRCRPHFHTQIITRALQSLGSSSSATVSNDRSLKLPQSRTAPDALGQTPGRFTARRTPPAEAHRPKWSEEAAKELLIPKDSAACVP